MQRKRSNEKKNKKKKSFSTYKSCFFFFFLFGFQISELSYFLFIYDNLKCYLSATWSSKSHVWTQITAEQHTSNCLGVQELVFVVFDGLFFFEFVTPFTLRGYNFFISNLFLTIIFVSDVPRAGVQVCLDNKNNRALPLYPGCPERFKCSATNQSTLCIVEAKESSLATFVPSIFHLHGKENMLFVCFIRISPAQTPLYSLHPYGPPPTRWQIFVTFVSNKIPVWLIQKIFPNKNTSQVCHISRKKNSQIAQI